MQVNFLTGRITEISTELLVGGLFLDARPVRGLSGQIDWLYSGLISHLIKQEKLSGSLGEAMLLSSGGKLSTPKIMVVGLGNKKEFTCGVLETIAGELFRRVRDLGITRVAVELLGSEESPLDPLQRFDSLLKGISHSGLLEHGEISLFLATPAHAARLTGRRTRHEEYHD